MSLFERFWAKVAVGDGCWEWTGYRLYNGYGRAKGLGHQIEYAHRVAWQLTHGPIAPGMYVCHSCDNRACVRPDHLFIGTQSDNIKDAVAKGRVRVPAGPRGPKSHCPKGHDSALYRLPSRHCSLCRTEQARLRSERRRATA